MTVLTRLSAMNYRIVGSLGRSERVANLKVQPVLREIWRWQEENRDLVAFWCLRRPVQW